MAGHSKWANIKHKKASSDVKRGKLFTRLIREIVVATKLGGREIAANPRLRTAVDKAGEANMPKDTITRAIQRGMGELEGTQYEEIRYEGYAPFGVCLLIDCATDNKTRTVAEVRSILSKNGGQLGTTGSVAYLFKHCGQFIFPPSCSEDSVTKIALECEADDVIVHPDGSIEVICAITLFLDTKAAFEKEKIQPEYATITMRPNDEVELTKEVTAKVSKLVADLENADDVQDVYTNAIYSYDEKNSSTYPPA